ncbi:hypothetical protein A3D14_02240 [Candidatus Saccharibacteria bacterium RIFCSPHIGHO2_02_FULL_47_12]|nr:MAG: hypothetical protein A3D14_02240 [Candidatus Saccharibacteria bacterium RIFCSPHIGHO2_02_FULL_47_12]
MPNQPFVSQEPLIVVSEQTGQLVPRDLSVADQDPAVSILERDLHLQNVITCLAGISMRRGFLSFDEPSVRSYGERAQTVRDNVEKKVAELTRTAKVEFAQAVGHYTMLDAGQAKQETKSMTRSMFSDFLKLYGGPRNYVRAQAFRRHLAQNVDYIQGKTAVGERIVDTAVPATEQKTASEPPKLERVERVTAILEDSRAGFLPATARETSLALTFLDYINNPSYTRGISDQLLEVFAHQQKGKGMSWRDGHRAIESIVYEMGDYLTNAINSHSALADLQQLVDDCPNPNVALAEEIGEVHPAYPALARFMDISEYAKTGRVNGLNKEAMRTREDRKTREGPGKHKTVEDQYTAKEPKPEFAERIANLPKNVTIGQARKIILEALSNEEKRSAFMTARLKDVRSLPGHHLFRSVFDIVEASLVA